MTRARYAMVLLSVIVLTASFAGGIAASERPAAASDAAASAAAGAADGCTFPFSKVDATGTEVTLEQEPETVVTLNPSAAQTMWEVGARDKVVGLTKYATYLDGAASKTNVSGGGFTTIVTEKVVALQPDLVLVPNATNNGKAAKIRQLREAGLTVYVFDSASSLEDVKAKTRLTGKLVGACDGAEATVSRMESRLATVREAVQGTDRPDVLFVLGPSGYTAGTGTFINTAIQTAGANNIAAQQNISFYKPISDEVVVNQSPDWIVKPTGVSLPKRDVYNESTAVKEGRVLEVNRNYVSQPAPRIVRAIVTMAKTFHPEAWAEANATATPTPTGTPTPTTSPTTTPTPTETGSPGFGLAVAVAALVGGAAVLRERRAP